MAGGSLAAFCASRTLLEQWQLRDTLPQGFPQEVAQGAKLAALGCFGNMSYRQCLTGRWVRHALPGKVNFLGSALTKSKTISSIVGLKAQQV